MPVTITTKYNKNRGFTFIEILIVLSIIGIIVGIALPNYNQYMRSIAYREVILNTGPVRKLIQHCYLLRRDLEQCDQSNNTSVKKAVDNAGNVGAEIISSLSAHYDSGSNVINIQIVTGSKTDNETITMRVKANSRTTVVGIDKTSPCVTSGDCKGGWWDE